MKEKQKSDLTNDYFRPTLSPYAISDALRPTIDSLGLWQNVEDLRDRGYTVVNDVAPLEIMDELREVIHQFAAETEGPAKGYAASMLLGRHPVVDKVATLPKFLALAEASLGKGFRAGQFIGSIKREGDRDCPPSHGEWLAKHFQAKTGVFDGYGHIGGAFIEQAKFVEELIGRP